MTTDELCASLDKFTAFVGTLKGDEKSEARAALNSAVRTAWPPATEKEVRRIRGGGLCYHLIWPVPACRFQARILKHKSEQSGVPWPLH